MLSEMQKQVEKRLSLLTFLYCSFYQIAIITIYFTITHFNINESWYWPYFWKILLLLLIAVLFWYSAYKFNCRICSREMWLVQNFEQSVDEIKKTDKESSKNTANIGIANSGA
jgi:Tfp pilus assembly protein PilO